MVTPDAEKTQSSPLEALIKAANAGDKVAYGKFLSEVSVLIRRFLAKRMATDDVEDVLQEILTSIHKARHTYDGTRPGLPWVYAIARSRLTDYLRKHYASRSDKKVNIDDVEYFLEAPVTESHELPEYMEVALGDLPEKQQKIITLMHVEGYTAKEVGGQLGMSESAVKVAAHRAYKKMKIAIEEAA